MKRLTLVALIIEGSLGSSAYASTKLWQNTCPPVAVSDPAYIAGVKAIATAIQAGSNLHASLQYNENGGVSSFFTKLTVVRVAVGQARAGQYANYASGLLALRPPFTAQAQATYGTSPAVGSIDTFGNYFFGSLGSKVTQYACYTITWFAD